MRTFASNVVLAGLSLVATAAAAGMAYTGKASWLEAASFVTGAASVWLTVRESAWNFPVGLVNVSTFSVLYFQARLYGDAGLQVVYFVLGIIGWYLWLRGGRGGTALRIVRTGARESAVVLLAMGGMTVLLWQTLHTLGGSASFWDALTTALSLGAQWLLTRKRLENWVLWIVADVIYIPLYLSKELYLTALLYAVFLAMAVMGFLQWRARWRTPQKKPRGFEVVMEGAV